MDGGREIERDCGDDITIQVLPTHEEERARVEDRCYPLTRERARATGGKRERASERERERQGGRYREGVATIFPCRSDASVGFRDRFYGLVARAAGIGIRESTFSARF